MVGDRTANAFGEGDLGPPVGGGHNLVIIELARLHIPSGGGFIGNRDFFAHLLFDERNDFSHRVRLTGTQIESSG